MGEGKTAEDLVSGLRLGGKVGLVVRVWLGLRLAGGELADP
ncbi:hypothetical protein ACFL0Q_00165 [Thermodesulfobacteriota bacterium]